MRRPELDHILTTMLDSNKEVSDLLFTINKPLQVESSGELKCVACEPPIESLTPFQTEMVALNLLGENQWHIEDLLRRGRWLTVDCRVDIGSEPFFLTIRDGALAAVAVTAPSGGTSAQVSSLGVAVAVEDATLVPLNCAICICWL